MKAWSSSVTAVGKRHDAGGERMGTMRRRAGVLLAAMIAAFTLGQASAQSGHDLPNGVFVRMPAGSVALVLDGQIVNVPVWPATIDQIAALPHSDRWAVLNAAGSIVAGDPPEWIRRTPTPVPLTVDLQSPEEAITLRGSTSQNTRPFVLRGGAYAVTWRASHPGGRQQECNVSAGLYRVEDTRRVGTIFSARRARDGDRSAAGETQMYGVQRGLHYLNGESFPDGCEWTVTIAPQ